MNQGQTKERPKNAEIENVLFIKIPHSFTSLIPCLFLPREHRPTTERTPTQLPASKKALFLSEGVRRNALRVKHPKCPYTEEIVRT